ncbi:carbohydrate-binding module family 20 domain-containing protein [Ideonella sp.]|uniref:carbohydrate-binding module family 20 domain-containing protein n=1 Tax=Ideonella sp. TaxID=1929293 RepID=UPI0035ADE2A4
MGDTPALGQWNPARGVPLRIQGSGADAPWSGTVTLPARSRVQYKYLKWDGRQAVWESAHPTPSGNREFSSCASGRSQRREDGAFRH